MHVPTRPIFPNLREGGGRSLGSWLALTMVTMSLLGCPGEAPRDPGAEGRELATVSQGVRDDDTPTNSLSDDAIVSAGGGHACALSPDGTVDCWGSNSNGQSADPEGTFIQISAGTDHTCGLRTDGAEAGRHC
ncbi:hypothetical protein ACMHYB_01515 [Sorangium sp. So ce1128]